MLYYLSCRNKCTKFINSIWWQTIPPITKQFIFWIIFILSIVSASIPFILNWRYPYSDDVNTYYSSLIEGSSIFKIINGILIGLSLPLFIDTIFDYFEKPSNYTDTLERMASVFYIGIIPAIVLILTETSNFTVENFFYLEEIQRLFLLNIFYYNLLNVKSSPSYLGGEDSKLH